MARDRPSPYGEVAFFPRSAGALGCHPRIRAGFPRDGSRTAVFIVARGPVPRVVPSSRGGVLGPTDLRDVFFRSAGALGCHTRIRAGFPRDRWSAPTMARDRPSPYGEGGLPPRRPIASRPGGLSYGSIARIETGRSLLHRFMKHPEFYVNLFSSFFFFDEAYAKQH